MAGLHGVFELSETGDNQSRGAPAAEGSTRVYGGHMIAQALLAIFRTVPNGWVCYCLHAQFARMGAPTQPIDYAVDRTTDSRNFAVRRVVAHQNGRSIMALTASLTLPSAGLEFQLVASTDAPPPETLESEAVRFGAVVDRYQAAGRIGQHLPSGIDARWSDPQNLEQPEVKSGSVQILLRTTEPVGKRAQSRQIALAYCSDFAFIEPILRPHGLSFVEPPTLLVGSLDHSIWFHRATDMTAWHQCDATCISTSGGLGFVRGELFDGDGRCIASIAQQGVLRLMTG